MKILRILENGNFSPFVLVIVKSPEENSEFEVLLTSFKSVYRISFITQLFMTGKGFNMI